MSGDNQVLREDELIEVVEFALPRDWKNWLLMQVHKDTDKYLYKLVKFCERLDTAKDVYYDQGESSHQNKKLSSLVLETKNPSWIAQGKTRLQNPWKRKQKTNNKNNNKPTCTLHGPGNIMNSCKVIQD